MPKGAALLAGLTAALSAGSSTASVTTPTYSPIAAKSEIVWNLPAPIPNPYHQFSDWQFTLSGTRWFASGDFNGDGLDDIVVAPSYFSWQPQLPIQIWVNRGDRTFADATSAVIEAPVPVVGVVNNILVADFNGDGRADIVIIDQGLEDKDPQQPGVDGGANLVLLSQRDGRLKDMTTSALSNNALNFNHVSSMADVNGDGFLDIIVTRLGGPSLPGEGTLFLLNDGAGTFTESTQGIPPEVAFRLYSEPFNPSLDRQASGTNGFFDLDGDGLPDLITGSYNGPDPVSHNRTLRFFGQLENGVFAERARMEVPSALAGIGYFGSVIGPDGLGLGVAGIRGADLNRDGGVDVVVLWEGVQKSYIEILRNDGGFRFTDVTLEWFGTYSTNVQSGGYQFFAQGYELRDLTGDGNVDILPLTLGYTSSVLWSGGFAFLNDGTGHFQPLVYRTANPSGTLAELMNALGCDYCGYRPLLFDATGDGQVDLVLVDNASHHTAESPHREGTVIVQTFTGRYGSTLSPSFVYTVALRRALIRTPVQFRDTSTGNVTSWTWKFGDGRTSLLRNPTHTYRRAGLYTVQLTVSDGTSSFTAERHIAVTRRIR